MGFRLFKPHGSISWLIEADGTVTEETLMGRSLIGRQFVGEMMVNQVQQKELYLEPYVSMLKELNRELREKSIWIVTGYSFNDPVIREIFVRNLSEEKKFVLLHPDAQKVKERRLRDLKCEKMSLLNKKFGEDDFMLVNYSLIKELRSNPNYSPNHTL